MKNYISVQKGHEKLLFLKILFFLELKRYPLGCYMSVGDISYNYPASSRVLRREREPGVGKLS